MGGDQLIPHHRLRGDWSPNAEDTPRGALPVGGADRAQSIHGLEDFEREALVSRKAWMGLGLGGLVIEEGIRCRVVVGAGITVARIWHGNVDPATGDVHGTGEALLGPLMASQASWNPLSSRSARQRGPGYRRAHRPG